MNLAYSWLPGCFARADSGLLEECAALYSNHYGVWSAQTPPPGRPGTRVRLSAARLKQWFHSDDSRIALARSGSDLVGYAIAVQIKAPRCGIVSWVTQLVVHEAHRQQNVGKTLLFSIWGMSNHFAWGLVTASPYAVRALEKATRRRCLPARIKRNNRKLQQLGCEHVRYINEQTRTDVDPAHSCIQTDFYLDHSDLGTMIARVTSEEKPWLLGSLPEGWEWFAFTFSDQDQIRLNSAEIASMLEASDQITKQAYKKVTLASNPATPCLDFGLTLAGHDLMQHLNDAYQNAAEDFLDFEWIDTASHATGVSLLVKDVLSMLRRHSLVCQEPLESSSIVEIDSTRLEAEVCPD